MQSISALRVLVAQHFTYKNRPDRYIDAIDRLHSHGLTVTAGFIIGLDGDSVETLSDVGSAAAQIGVDRAFNILVPLPGRMSLTVTTMERSLRQIGRSTPRIRPWRYRTLLRCTHCAKDSGITTHRFRQIGELTGSTEGHITFRVHGLMG